MAHGVPLYIESLFYESLRPQTTPKSHMMWSGMSIDS